MSDGLKIKFNFLPFEHENRNHVVEKSESGKKRKYLIGVSSGLKLDGHREKMSENCIKSFHNQATSGQVLLYPDIHGIKASDDIGILTKSEILPNQDWKTEYRLYDEDDGIGQYKLEKINDIWKQLNGMPPYKKAVQKGFSIEGIVPSQNVINMNDSGEKVIDDVLLDGVVLVPRPAYETSIAHSIYKALGELNPYQIGVVKKSIESELKQVLDDKQTEHQFYSRKYDIESAFENLLERIMSDIKPQKAERLKVLFDEYQNIMIDLIMANENLFKRGNESIADEDRKTLKTKVLKGIFSNLKKFKDLKEITNGKGLQG